MLTNKTIFIVEIKELNTPYSTTFKLPSTKDPEGVAKALDKLGFKSKKRLAEDNTVHKLTSKKFVLKDSMMYELDVVYKAIKPYIH